MTTQTPKSNGEYSELIKLLQEITIKVAYMRTISKQEAVDAWSNIKKVGLKDIAELIEAGKRQRNKKQ